MDLEWGIMKLLIVKIFVLGIKILYAPMQLRKIENKVLYLSRQSNEKSADMLMLEAEIKRLSPETKQVFRLRRLKDESSISLSYIFSILADMWEMASAKVIITDTYSIPVSCLPHKNTQKVVQIWHAMGAVKKFSLQAAGKAQGRDLGVAKAMHMHENYDYVLAPSKATGEIYCDAFGCKEENIKLLCLPRVDVILDGQNRRNEFVENNPDYADKIIVAYVPTFRDKDDVYAEKLHKAFDGNEKYKLAISSHPLSKTTEKGLYTIKGGFSSLDLMKLADIVITDYSACAFEAALLEKPLYFFVPDYEIYKAEQGLNVDVLTELPQVAFVDECALVSALNVEGYDFSKLNAFSDKYVENKITNNTELLAEFIKELLK